MKLLIMLNTWGFSILEFVATLVVLSVITTIVVVSIPNGLSSSVSVDGFGDTHIVKQHLPIENT